LLSGGVTRSLQGKVSGRYVTNDHFGVDFRMAATGENPVEAARQVSGMRVITAIDRIWVGS
jgi:hypothetical protein